MVWRTERIIAAILLFLGGLMLIGCAAQETGQNRVINEYLLKDAGFTPLPVNDQTPNRKALMAASPAGKFIDYQVGPNKYYVYNDARSHTLYVGDEAAYQKFVSKMSDKQLCQSLDAEQSAPFWSCFQDFQKARQR